ncbi:MAG: Serine--tRNA ligase, mitochondrial [Lichina confinis]|nr:MAG: Serine--tRNA ligase, mitochondrial [Lichina confinis]
MSEHAAVSTIAVESHSVAPKPQIDIKHIRSNPELYSRNCEARKYKQQASIPPRIVRLFERWQQHERASRALRERNNQLGKSLSEAARHSTPAESNNDTSPTTLREKWLQEAREIKTSLATVVAEQDALNDEMLDLALQLPNLTSPQTPIGDEPRIVGYLNEQPASIQRSTAHMAKSHVEIGKELDLLDFGASAATSGWGWYFLKKEAARLERALVGYALAEAGRRGWEEVTPPSIVYSHVGTACGFQPRDQHGEQQVYVLQRPGKDQRKPEQCLAGTAEIPLAGMRANSILPEQGLPYKVAGASRCFRAEAGARGVDTKGLYRVHEFTKVEMFAWTAPEATPSASSEAIFDEMVSIQTEILRGLGLHCRILEMPTSDLGASATRKCDIEAYFPSRRAHRDGGWGEVTSASICTDYQTRRLATRVRLGDDRLSFPHTVNGTALAVPRVLAALLENGWDADQGIMRIPAVLRPWMGGQGVIRKDSKGPTA